MRAVVVALIGSVIVAVLVRVARRWTVRDRLTPRHWRRQLPVPAPLAAAVARALDAAAIDVGAKPALTTGLTGVLVAVVTGSAIGGAPMGVLFGVVVAVGAPVVVWTQRHRRARQIAAAVPATLERIASELRAGGTIATAVAGVATEGGPLAADFARVDARVRLGATTVEALRAWAGERRGAATEAAAGALAMGQAVGGRSADALDGLAAALRDRLAVSAEARALSAQARMSAIVVGGVPVAYLAWSAAVDPAALHALTATAVGHTCLAVGVALEVAGAFWMRRIISAGDIE